MSAHQILDYKIYINYNFHIDYIGGLNIWIDQNCDFCFDNHLKGHLMCNHPKNGQHRNLARYKVTTKRFENRFCRDSLLNLYNRQCCTLTGREHPPPQKINIYTVYLGVSKNRGIPKSSILYNRVFHYKPSILGYPYFRKPPFIQ